MKQRNRHSIGISGGWHPSRAARLRRWLGARLTRGVRAGRFVAQRIRQEELPQVAGSLTFTTILALVPLLTIALAIFTAFPLFGRFRIALENYFVDSLMPSEVARTILDNLNMFASKSARLSALGALALVVTSGFTIATIDRVFNRIWRVRQERSGPQRMLVYWAAITAGPLLMGISVTATSWIVRAAGSLLLGSFGVWIYTALSLALNSLLFAALYVFVPNTRVRWHDAILGGMLAAASAEIAKQVFATYVIRLPTYTVVYGALAALPIFLVWIYTMWLITLVGAAVAAAVPAVRH